MNRPRSALLALAASAIFALSACGGSPKAVAPQPSPTDAADVVSASPTPTPTTDTTPSGDFCALIKELDNRADSDNPSADDVRQIGELMTKLVAASPQQIRKKAALYFGQLGEVLKQGKGVGDIQNPPQGFMDAFSAVFDYSSAHCDMG